MSVIRPGLLGIALGLALGTASCTYSPLDLVCRPGDPSCAPCVGGTPECPPCAPGDEGCVDPIPVPCDAVVCPDGQTCVEGTCNAPPIAQFPAETMEVAGGAATLAITVEAYDQDGDPLTYTWSGAGSCADLTAETLGPTLYWTMPPPPGAEACLLTVVVSDGTHHVSADVTLTFTPGAIDAFVDRSATNCIEYAAGFDAGSSEPRGTPTRPWCALQSGLDAAALYGIAAVRVSAATQVVDATTTVNGTLIVPHGVWVYGGYPPFASVDWRDATKTSTAIRPSAAIGVLIDGSGPTNAATSARVTQLVGLDFARVTSCTESCSVVSVQGDVVVMDGVRFGTVASAAGYSPLHRAPSGSNFTNLEVRGVGDGRRTHLSVQASRLFAPAVGDVVRGIFVDGTLGSTSLRVVGSTVEVAASRLASVVVDARRAERVTIEQSSLRADASASSDTQRELGVVLRDGDEEECTRTNVSACAGSTLVEIVDSELVAQTYWVAHAISARGTGSVIVKGALGVGSPALQAHARASGTAIRTTLIGSMSLDGTSVRATTEVANAYMQYNFALGIYDGDFDQDPLPGTIASYGGAMVVTLVGSTVEALRGATSYTNHADFAIAAAFRAAGSITVEGSTLRTDELAAPGADSYVEEVAALWTRAVGTVSVSGSMLTTGPIPGGTTSAIIADGTWSYAASEPRSGAAAYTVRGSTLQGSLDIESGTSTPERACALFSGTGGLEFEGNTVLCDRAEGTYFLVHGAVRGDEVPLAGVWTRGTRDAKLFGNVIRVANDNETLAPVTLLAGVWDGMRRVGDAIEGGSSGLVLEANRIYVSATRTNTARGTLYGVWFVASPGEQRILNNYIALWGSDRIVGVTLDHVLAEVAHNTVRMFGCEQFPGVSSSCTAPLPVDVGDAAVQNVDIYEGTAYVGPYEIAVTGTWLPPYVVGVYSLDGDEDYVDASGAGHPIGAGVWNNLIEFGASFGERADTSYAFFDDVALGGVGFDVLAGNLVVAPGPSVAFSARGSAHGLPSSPDVTAVTAANFQSSDEVGTGATRAPCENVSLTAEPFEHEPGHARGFALGPSAQARDKGCSKGLGAPWDAELDVEGTRRPLGGPRPDIGAHERD